MNFPHFSIIDTTLREGEQFLTSHFTTEHKLRIAALLDEFGVECIEVTSPVVSKKSAADLKLLVSLGLKTEIITHIRCCLDDVKCALDTGVQQINMFINDDLISKYPSTYELVNFVTALALFAREKNRNIKLRFSVEDSFRKKRQNLLKYYRIFYETGLFDRFAISDTTGGALPHQVSGLVKRMKRWFPGVDLEFHGHNDTGCALINSFYALRSGASFLHTSVLGIGERNGITSLSAFIARLYSLYPEKIKKKYNLETLKELTGLVSEIIGFPVPFNHPVTGESAFVHKSGIHTRSVLSDPGVYEILRPSDFGLEREILVAHNLTGKECIRNKARDMGLHFNENQLTDLCLALKEKASHVPVSSEELENILVTSAHKNDTKLY